MDKYSGLKIQMNEITKKRLIFSSFFIIGNKLQTLFDNYLGEITSKQWLIMIIVSAFPEPPSLSEVARRAGCSRQNVKKVAAVLEKKGFLKFQTERNSRAVCIVLTQKFYDFYTPFLERSTEGIGRIFDGISTTQIEELFGLMNKIDENIDKFAVHIEGEEALNQNKK